ncbi:GH20 [uncultured Rubrobacteraceae bacterium]|uniref:beta-N-acetylhexosaminidase n=1 Tax=uncultured Rubrobacteraceae bacterium TaxID=349277 RepID=A0A6J4PMU4_9ACTN|nr:GH20 [uncultured Rubrobacteraceae bacterium]
MASIEDLILLPTPRSAIAGPGAYGLSGGSKIVCRGDTAALFPIARRLRRALWENQRIDWTLRAGGSGLGGSTGGATIMLSPDGGIPAQGYRLSITGGGIDIVAGDAAGAFYGVATLVQMLRQCEGVLPAGEIEDSPDFPSRGVMLDISRSKVPTLGTLFDLVDLLSGWKINHLELYTEHTFAYENHREVWAQASPMTGEDILRLDAYCRERFVELVPNQNSFGHMHRWLTLPRYNHLAEWPNGFDLTLQGNTTRMPPFSLNPTDPRSIELMEELYSELLPHFTSERFNVGCDETWDVGRGRSARAVGERGAGRVYLDYLLAIHRLVKRHGRAMHFWGDIIIQHPELVPELPEDVVVLEWGYEAGHPFDEHGAEFARSGIPFFVCPGTSSWNSIAGRTSNCLSNVRNASGNGLRHGAVGVLITDWGDNGHTQYLPVSYPGFAAGAALSWCHEANRGDDFVQALDLHAFRDGTRVMGVLSRDLGDAHEKAGPARENSTVLFNLLTQAPDGPLPDGVTVESLGEACEVIGSIIGPLESTRMDREDAGTIRDEFANAARMMLHACKRGTAMLEGTIGSAEKRRQLASEMRTILGEHRRLWMARNRVGGLQDSERIFEERLHEYLGT